MRLFFKVFLIVIFSLCFAGSCKKQEGKVKIAADFQLIITHVGCRGYCPDFCITVDAKGNVLYNGKRNVDQMGEYTKNIGMEKTKELIATLAKYKYSEFSDEYGTGVADLPSVITEVVLDGKNKKINNIRYAPVELTEMQKKLEEIIGPDAYSKK